ncbi:Hypothetical predicted protein, partial [Pelobates cultripes]
MEESQAPSDLQAMIAAAEAASMEVFSKMFPTQHDAAKPTSERTHYGADSEDSDSSMEQS